MRSTTAGIAGIFCAVSLIGCDPSAGTPTSIGDAPLRVLDGHTNYVTDITINPNGEQLISGGADGTIRFWDIATGHCQRTINGHTEWVHSVALSPDGRTLASGGRDNLVKLWDVASGNLLKTLEGHTGSPGIVFSVAYSPNAELLASCGDDKVIKIWDVSSGMCLKIIRPDTYFSPSEVCFTQDSKQLLCASDALELFDVDSGSVVRTFKGHTDRLHSVALSGNGKWIASCGAGQDPTIRLWELDSGKELWTAKWAESEHDGSDWCVAFAANDRILVSGSNDIRYWDVKTGACVHTVQAHSEVIPAIECALSGEFVVSASWDKSIKIWAPFSLETPGEVK